MLTSVPAAKMPEFPYTTRVAAYPRVSTEEQKRHGLSIEAQTEALQAWADQNKLTIVSFYNDAGNSARKPYHKRPAMLRLLEDVQAGKIDLVIFTKLDRWFRNVGEYYKVQEILDAHKVAWKAIQEDYDTTTAAGRLKINIMLSVAQDEADRGSERIRAVFAAKRERLEPLTGHVPTGYKIDGKKVVKDPALEDAVACYFSTFLQLRSIEKARTAVQEQFGVSFSYQLADAMLRKEAYYGRFGGVDGMCPAYITKEQYEDIRASRRRVERKTTTNRIYLFTGLIFCPECGRRMGSRSHMYRVKSGGTHERVAYNCPGRYHHNDCTNHTNLGETKIETYLLDHIDEALHQYQIDLERLAAARTPRRDFEIERSRLRKKLSRLKDLYLNDIIDLELYRKDYQDLNSQLDRLAAEESTAPPDMPNPDRLFAIFTPGWQEIYLELSRPEKQNFWRMALDKIYVHNDRQISFTFRV